MSSPFDRWAQGPGGGQQGNYENWNEIVGSAPPEHFNRAVQQAASQIDPQEYQSHFQNQPLQQLQPQQQSGLAQTLVSALLNKGVNQQQVMQNTGVSSLNPQQMSPQDIASLLQYTQQNHPQVLGNVASQYQSQPDVLHSILGNKALMAAAAGLAGAYLTGQIKRKQP